MKKTVISVTDASRNFADCVNRARYQHATFVLHKNGTPVAELRPVAEKICSGRDLAEALNRAKLPAEKAVAGYRDLKAARKALNLYRTDSL